MTKVKKTVLVLALVAVALCFLAAWTWFLWWTGRMALSSGGLTAPPARSGGSSGTSDSGSSTP
ncbi:MAG: hypothetical protein HY321_21015 [Armatimonadetes bacterium]|nr:hypothetical protein [Armatimonadota bacterium]